MQFGATCRDGTVEFRLWAPLAAQVRLAVQDSDPVAMHRDDDGWHTARLPGGAGLRYSFLLPDGLQVPDPASRFQPDDVFGASEVIDPGAYAWTDDSWRGRPWEEAVIYELHVGTFTPGGTFKDAIGKLPHLADLGVTAVQIMPVADFPGRRNWGYDGVLLFAPDSAYGRPEDMKAFIDAAHGLGLMVFLDVVYNHLGPEGNFLPLYAPLFNERHQTPWGAAINFDGEGSYWIRQIVIQNALYWVQEYHLDGLRLDAVHGILDDSTPQILTELADRVRQSVPGRQVHLILENEENEASRLDPRGVTQGAYTAQWNDDVHHVLHTALTGESQGYYADYAERTDLLGRSLAEGFAFQGEPMPYRGSPRGEPSAGLPPTAFVAFLQNHDQIGNRATGDRIAALAPPEAIRAAVGVYLLSPQIPMLFMGEEWGTARSFPFFVGFEGELADKVREGRQREFERFPEFKDPDRRSAIPDPAAEATFRSAKLDWDELARDPHREWLSFYRRLLHLRQAEIVPRLRGIDAAGSYTVIAAGAVVVTWSLADGVELILHANLSPQTTDGFPPLPGRVVCAVGPVEENGAMGPWAVRWAVAG
jgi:maltooligosyltrehalose trehalohydrolase